jgi:DNA-binding transcriptional MerR regulator
MYTIKQAAARSGLTVPTVRVWERRYGVVHPARTATGYRLYDDDAIARLIAMRYLTDGRGMRPSQAAEQLLEAGAELDPLLEASRAWWASRGVGVPDPSGERPATANRDAVASFVTAARSLDLEAMEQAIDEAFAAERFEAAMDHVIFPALRAIGDGWADGSVDVAMEHAASEVVRRRLARFYDAAGAVERAADVVVGLPPGSHHDIGVLAFAVTARRAGLGVLYLGANVPVESWALAMTTTAAPVAVIGVVVRTDVAPAERVVVALRDLAHAPTVHLGGAAAHRVTLDPSPDLLPERIEDAVAVIARRVTPAA